MSMYNEVYKICPACTNRGILQIPQIVLGYGEFNLNNFETLKQLNNQQLFELRSAISGKYFQCDKCDESFIPFQDLDKDEIIKKLFTSPEGIF